jgi:NAD(P)-dependent dehydrogenase (short-subunit alcohol dehydrogenase family)
MDVQGKVVVVTGGGNGIGKALCRRFAANGAKLMVSDRDMSAAQGVADELGAKAFACDVSREEDIVKLVAATVAELGDIDLFCSNAGVGFGDGGPLATSAANSVWQTCWDIHVMAHVYAARAVLPSMIARGSGYFLQTVSAAGLLNQIGDAAYSTTKHAAIGFAESLAITHRDDGIKVSVLCPQYVATRLIGIEEGADFSDQAGVISPEVAADAVVKGLAEEQFIILTHPEVALFKQRKAEDYDRWISGMSKLRKKLMGAIR